MQPSPVYQEPAQPRATDGWRRSSRFRHLGQSTVVAGLALCALAAKAAAQPLATEEDFLAAIPTVVTASRLEKPLLETGMSVTVIDRQMIEASPAIEIPDLLRLVPGFQVAHTTGGTFAATYHGASDQWPRTMEVMVDGRPVYLNTISNIEWSALGLAIEDIERIEVVRGPNAASFGSNALAASINIITRAPFLMSGTYLRGTVGSLDTANGVLRWGGGLGGWDVSLTGQYRSDEGFDNINDDKELGDVRLRGDYQASATDSWSIQLGLTSGGVGADARPADPSEPARDRELRSHYQHLTWNRVSADASRHRVNLMHQYDSRDDRYTVDLALLGLPPGLSLPLGPYTSTSERFDVEYQHTLAPRDHWRLAWGVGVRHDVLSSEFLLGERKRVGRSSGRVFAGFEWKPVEELLFSLDLMTERHEGYVTKSSPRAGLTWLPDENRSFRAIASRAYRVHGLLERFGDFRLVAQPGGINLGTVFSAFGNDNPQPEKLTVYELGYGEHWKEANLTLDVRLFREEFRDMGNDVRKPRQPGEIRDPFFWSDQTGGWNVDGIEAQLDYRPGAGTRLVAAYSYADIEGRLIDRVDAGGSVSRFEDLSDTTPQHTFSALLSHAFGPHWSASLALYHVDDMRWRGEGSQVEDYTRVDLKLARNLRLDRARAQLALLVHDLAGSGYHEFRDPDFSSRDGNRFDRRAYLQLSVEFD
jgi:iron complex outermembrane receptor protein